MGMDADIKTQISGFNDTELREWINKMKHWTKSFGKQLAEKEGQTATFLGARTQSNQSLPVETIAVIEAGNKPLFHGYVDDEGNAITDVENPLYAQGLFEQIPSFEDPMKPIAIHIPKPEVVVIPEPEPEVIPDPEPEAIPEP